ncbi:MAG: GSCFA domain-containing protein [Albidovulum sp.]|uniref:GSCFA domain-containing protein n=1 Tax=Albidovulum sp. TaxID=1872424 RepID=UPI003C8E1B01
MSHPYTSLPPDRFWKTAVGALSPFEISGLWTPKFRIGPRMTIVTAGSCFAQHFSRALVARRYAWKDYEPGPSILTDAQRKDYHYGTFSFRTGNIYTPRMLLQWLQWAFDMEPVPEEVWEKDGRYYDPMRPGVEPGGFASPGELHASRAETLAAIREAVTNTQVFVFTMGLTESWYNLETGHEYAICPGTIAGQFDPEKHAFRNHDFSAASRDMRRAIKILSTQNRRIRILLTVSPVPLTATASDQHVLLATSHSKSLLRAVAGEICEKYANVDYFPSYEIITAPAFRGMFFAPNMRSVTQAGVDFVMQNFFNDQARVFGANPAPKKAVKAPASPMDEDADAEDDLRCEEEILNSFAR